MIEETKKKTVVRAISIPIELDTRFNTMFQDPFFKRIVYGTRSRIICKILTEYLDEIESGKRPFDPNIF